MKKTLVLIGIMLLVASSLTAADFFKDVPTSHWAYDAIQKVVDAGILKGYPGDLFKGKQILNRYQFAMATARILDTTGGGTSMGGDELNAIKSLTKEFADELAILKNKVSGHEDRISALEKKVFGRATAAVKEDKWEDEDDKWEDEDDKAVKDDDKWEDEDDTWNDEATTARKRSPLKDDRYNVLDKWHFGVIANWYEPDGYDWNNTTVGTTRHSFDSLVESSTYIKGQLGYTFKNRWRVELGGGKWTMNNSKTAASDGNVQLGLNEMVQDIDDLADTDVYANPEPFYDATAGVLTTYQANNAFLDLDITPIELDLSYVFPNSNPKFKPYAGVGAGQYSVTSDFYWRTATNAKLLQIRTDHNISCFNIHGGFDYFISDDFAVRFDVKYVMNDDALTVDSTDVTYDSATIGGSLLTAPELAAIVTRYNAAADNFDLAGYQVGIGFSYFFK